MQSDIHAHTETPASAGPAASPPVPRTRWIGWILVVGLAVGVPAGWLLAYLAALPFLLGLFFFLLIGLLIGAVMFRVGSSVPMPSTGTLWLIGSTVVVVLMFTSLWAEFRALPRSVEKRVRESYFESFTAERRAELGRGVREYVAAELSEVSPPGGFVGYLRWAATSGELSCPRILKESTVEYRLPYRRLLWTTRVGLSFVLLGWAIMSQLLGLAAVPGKGSLADAESEAAGGPEGVL